MKLLGMIFITRKISEETVVVERRRICRCKYYKKAIDDWIIMILMFFNHG